MVAQEINPTTDAAEVQSISFRERPLYLDDDPTFNLVLGPYLIVSLGSSVRWN